MLIEKLYAQVRNRKRKESTEANIERGEAVFVDGNDFVRSSSKES
jgi:hypothetical protein